MALICVLSSTTFKGTQLDTWFKSNLKATTQIEYFDGAGDYKEDSSGKLKVVAEKIPPWPEQVNLVVTVGGLVAAEAAANLKTSAFTSGVPQGFLSIFGAMPKKNSDLFGKNPNNILFLGGIGLDTPNHNPERVAALMKNFASVTDLTKIWLYYNDNSHMHKDEIDEWNFYVGGKTKPSSVDQTGFDKTQFDNDFATSSIPSDAQAIVISADPFFGSKASDLVSSVYSVRPNLPVCYPIDLYKPVNAAKAVVYGPKLEDAFKALGAKAQSCIDNMTSTFIGVEKQISSQILVITGAAAAKKTGKKARKKTGKKK